MGPTSPRPPLSLARKSVSFCPRDRPFPLALHTRKLPPVPLHSRSPWFPHCLLPPSSPDPDKVKQDSSQISIQDAMDQSRSKQGTGLVSPGECNMRDQKLHGSKTAWGSSKSERFPAPKKNGMKEQDVPGPAGGSNLKSSKVPDVSGDNWKGHTTDVRGILQVSRDFNPWTSIESADIH